MEKAQSFNKTVCIYFQVHQPYRVRHFSFFESDDKHDYFTGPENFENKRVFEKVATKCYIPATDMLLELIDKHPEFRVSFSLSGVFLEQCDQYGKVGQRVLKNFKALAASPQVEFLSETYHHSLAFIYSKLEFAHQIKLHREKLKKLLKVTPKVFRNTELIYNNELAAFIKAMGFQGVLAEGWDDVLKEDSPHHVMEPASFELNEDDLKIAQKHAIAKHPKKKFGVLLKDYKLSDDIAFRFGNKKWEEYPLDAEKFARWANDIYGETINLFMDFETIGEHQWEDTGIFNFFRALPAELLKHNIGFKTPFETIKSYPIRGVFDCQHFLSWADMERNLSAWLDNDLQKSALEELKSIESLLHPLRDSRKKHHKSLLEDFRKLQTSDHLYYMSTKYWADGDVHTYFSPFETPYDAYMNFMNVIQALKRRIKDQ